MGAGFFERLFQLLQHDQLWIPLGVVLSTAVSSAGYACFWLGRHFPKHDQTRPTDGIVDALTVQLRMCTAETHELHEKLQQSVMREEKNNKIQEAILDDESEL
jgi:hypothetical protein